MMHFVRTFSIMRSYGVRLIASIKEVQSYEKIVYIKSIFENGSWEDAYSSSYPPVSAPGHKLQKLSKESDIFRSSRKCSRISWIEPALKNSRIFSNRKNPKTLSRGSKNQHVKFNNLAQPTRFNHRSHMPIHSFAAADAFRPF